MARQQALGTFAAIQQHFFGPLKPCSVQIRDSTTVTQKKKPIGFYPCTPVKDVPYALIKNINRMTESRSLKHLWKSLFIIIVIVT